jgi:hypothetical protein
MNAALQIAQQNYDRALPPEDDGFLETAEGQDWVERSTAKLMIGKPVTKPNPFGRDQILVLDQHLVESVANHLSANSDDGYAVERILIEIMRRAHKDDALYRLASEALGVADGECRVVQDLALELLSPVAEEYAEAVRADDKAQSECGF